MRSRTWNLRLNLDEFNAAFAALCDDTERAQFLAGMSCGMNCGNLRETAPQAYREGYAIGGDMRVEAENFRAKKAEDGKKGGRPPKTTRKPDGNHVVNHEVTTTKPQANHYETQSTIHRKETHPEEDAESKQRGRGKHGPTPGAAPRGWNVDELTGQVA